MKSHHNYVFIQILWYIGFIYDVIFILKRAADFSERSSLRVSSAVGAYWNPCVVAYGLAFLHMISFSLQYHNIPEIIFRNLMVFWVSQKKIENFNKTTHSSGQTYLQDVVVYKRIQISLFTKNVFEYKVCGR